MNGEEGRDNPQMMVPKKTNGNMIDGDTIVNMHKDLIRFQERTKEGSFFFFSNYMESKGETQRQTPPPIILEIMVPKKNAWKHNRWRHNREYASLQLYSTKI